MTTLLGVDVAGRDVLVAGGGPVAARRARALVADGAHVRVVAPWACEDLRDLVATPDAVGPGRGTVRWDEREVVEADVDGAWLVHAATDSTTVNRDVARWAEARRTWCVVASEVDDGTARTPAVTRSGDVVVGVVSAHGADPRRARGVRDAIAEHLRTGVDQRRRRTGPGSVVLVGGGPGAVDLLTVRGRRALAEADVVVTDRLGPTGVLDELAPGVEVVDVGKTPGHHAVPQHEINAILVEQARRGRRVVRLKGGDPFVFGRGGEEVDACREAGVAVEVVPGISSALSVPALAGIPLTHRGTVAAFHVVTGHDSAGRATLDAAAVASVVERAATLVVLMGVSALDAIAAQLTAAGADAATPVAIVERGSTPQQRVTRSTLADVARRAGEVGVRAPAVIVVGDVAALDLA
ncbi:uroporphyrin-III C-methyltransferase/precorrin-2 dehydrogenase/sirohydrochlorin ferrochelatase [Sediminihabitans luteus]|uniref:uroporphyrinogen-III C-methyltransferase n=1 Tax=Sediminihabitans luteus TaxID=1138585 RepID=A0A2M9D0B4_9CELL|nr:uroporphyrinogen-III C-methyltransferase [Sediminihabitans luteus]PJJ77543.1 uroporphyrin-III C-methyltransferase/precorrin-2 dehydrogenase/sirohydrochlorin ferrochelatase [Sediminihabitans luteus]GII98442.1 uroporphyrinogen-III C-methyltransferase [Sediminihabitans luteus]